MSSYRQHPHIAASTAVLLLLACVVSFAACTGLGARDSSGIVQGSAVTAPNGGPASAWPSLPAPSTLPRMSSAAAPPPRYRRGAEYEQFLPSLNVSLPQGTLQPGPGGNLLFSSSGSSRLGSTAYALFRIAEQTGADGPGTVSIGWQQPPEAGTVWVALANCFTDRWDWFALQPGSSSISLKDQEPYVAAFGQSFAAVLLTGSQDCELSWLLWGPPLAEAEAVATEQVTSAGLAVSLDASNSFVFGANEWFVDVDWDDDGVFELLNDEDGQAEHIYPFEQAGAVMARVRVHDGAGTADDTTLSLQVPDGSQPFAQFNADITEGPAPLKVTFDASASLASNGAALTNFEWDVDGDGDFERSTGLDPHLSFDFGKAGPTSVGLRVTDTAALSDTASLSITLSSGWHRVVIDSNASLETSDPAIALIGPLASRRPAVAYHDALSGSLRYSIADNRSATNWGSPITVDTGNTGYGPALADVAGLPAIAYNAPSEWTPGAQLFYVRAKDTEGAQWETPLELSETNGGETVMFVTDGKPAIYSITNKYSIAAYTYLVGYRSLDATGGSWREPEVPDYVEEEAYVYGLSTMQLDGKPALFYGFYADTPAELRRLRFTRAEQANAGTWLDPVVFGSGTAGYSALAVCDGKPAAAFADFMLQDGVFFIRANEADGSSWPKDAISVDPRAGVGASCAMALVGGLPLLTYHDSNTGDLLAVFAGAADGSTWDEPMLVDGTGNVGLFSELIYSGSAPVVVYNDATDNMLLGAWYE